MILVDRPAGSGAWSGKEPDRGDSGSGEGRGQGQAGPGQPEAGVAERVSERRPRRVAAGPSGAVARRPRDPPLSLRFDALASLNCDTKCTSTVPIKLRMLFLNISSASMVSVLLFLLLVSL